ncbi:ferredoxin [Desulfosarcina sp.]|uniref:ferredoxin n=1 Tax=Desulfosarcina sp. TaxID=2027861 RepID=UPI0035616C99
MRTITNHRRYSGQKNMGVLAINRPASYHVNHRCIGCCICSAISPKNFRSNHEHGVDYVYQQPSGPEEERLCAEAMDICPVNAIDKLAKGNRGPIMRDRKLNRHVRRNP